LHGTQRKQRILFWVALELKNTFKLNCFADGKPCIARRFGFATLLLALIFPGREHAVPKIDTAFILVFRLIAAASWVK